MYVIIISLSHPRPVHLSSWAYCAPRFGLFYQLCVFDKLHHIAEGHHFTLSGSRNWALRYLNPVFPESDAHQSHAVNILHLYSILYEWSISSTTALPFFFQFIFRNFSDLVTDGLWMNMCGRLSPANSFPCLKFIIVVLMHR